MFCLDEPDRHPGFSAANDRTLAFAGRSEGALVPFVRLDLNETPDRGGDALPRPRRARDQAAPARAGLRLDDERLAPVFELAAERRVPILIHGGRGLPPIAARLALPRRPLRGAADHRPRRHRRHGALARGDRRPRRSVVFDTSTWSPIDLLDFYRQVPPEQVVYASDYPYGQYTSSLQIALRTAIMSGFDEAQLRPRCSAGPPAGRGRAERRCSEPTTPLGPATYHQPMQLARIHQYLSMATPLLWTSQADTLGVLGLAINTCAERRRPREEVDRIRELLVARDLWRTLPGRQRRRPRRAARAASG